MFWKSKTTQGYYLRPLVSYDMIDPMSNTIINHNNKQLTAKRRGFFMALPCALYIWTNKEVRI
jgi:hypothetical protein